jgi:argininosuccinate lyase
VKRCEEEKKYLWEMSVEEMRSFCEAFDGTIFDYIEPHNVVKSRKTAGGASIGEVDKQIETAISYLDR